MTRLTDSVTKLRSFSSAKIETQIATLGQTVFNLISVTYAPSVNSLTLYVDGIRVRVTDDYIETDADTVTFNSGLPLGSEVTFVVGEVLNTSVAAASIVTYTQPSVGAVPRNVDSKLQEIVSVKDFGAVGDGIVNDTTAIQAAINSLGVPGGIVYFPKGKYRITTALTVSTPKAITFKGDGEGYYTGADISTIYCKDLTTYVFSVDGLSKTFSIESLAFSGCNGLAISTANSSSTWKGVLDASGINQFATMYFCHVVAFGSNASFPMWNLGTAFFYHFESCRFGNWHFHQILKLGGSGALTTTATFTKCYFNYCREIGLISSTTDVQFRSCVFESSVVALAIFNSNVLLDGCYFENIGYDVTTIGMTTGITGRGFGFSESPAIAGSVTSAFTARYGLTTLLNCIIAYRGTAGSWFDGIGRGSSIDTGGCFKFINCTPQFALNGTVTLFRADNDTPSSKASFEYLYDSTFLSTNVVQYSDARLLSKGRITHDFQDSVRRLVEVDQGKFIVNDSITGFAAVPTTYPFQGQWNIGDQVIRTLATQGTGRQKTWEVSGAGTTGAKFDVAAFTPASKSANIVAGATMDFGGSLSEVGESHFWEIITTSTNLAIAYRATVAVTKLPSANNIQIVEHVGAGTGTISLPITSDTYTLRYTNGGVTVNAYAYLRSVVRSHT